MKAKTKPKTKATSKTKPKTKATNKVKSKAKAVNKLKSKARTKTSLKNNSEGGISKNKAVLSIIISFFLLLGAGLYMNKNDIFPASAETTLSPGLTTNRILKLGMSGEDVKTLNRNLTWLGYLKINVSTAFTEETQAAVKAFQKYAGIEETGVANKSTLRRLNIWQGQSLKGSIAVVGDSMSEENRDLITKNILNKGYRITDMFTVGGTQMVGNSPYNSVDGKTIITYYNSDKNNNPNNWLIILGSNDVFWDSALDTWNLVKNELTKTVAEFKQLNDKVHWVNVYVKDIPDTTKYNELTNSKKLNGWLNEQATIRGNMNIIDWYSVGDSSQVLLRDYIHVKSDYRQKFADTATSSL